MSDFETGIENKTPLIAQRGQESGRLIKENNFVVNLADWLSELATPGSGVSLNVTDNGSGVLSIPNFRASTLEGRKIHYQLSFDTGLDTLNDVVALLDGSIMAESRNASDSSATGAISADIATSSLSLQTVEGNVNAAVTVLQSKNYIKIPQSGITYLEVQGVFANTGATNGTSVAFVGQVGGGLKFQDSWNVDTFGAGALNPSNITIDLKKVQTVVLQIVGKNKGSVRFGFLIDDTLYFANDYQINNNVGNTKTLNLPFMDEMGTQPLPLTKRFTGLFDDTSGYYFGTELDTTNDPGITSQQYLNSVVCYTVGADPVENRVPFVIGNKETYKTVTVPDFPLFSIKCAPSFGGGINRSVFNFDKLMAQAAELNLNYGCYIKVFYNTQLIGTPSFLPIPDNSESALVYDIAATGMNGGIELFSAPLMANQIVEFSADDIFKSYRNSFSRNDITSAGFSNEVLEQVLTVAVSPMSNTPTIQVSANIFGGEVG